MSPRPSGSKQLVACARRPVPSGAPGSRLEGGDNSVGFQDAASTQPHRWSWPPPRGCGQACPDSGQGRVGQPSASERGLSEARLTCGAKAGAGRRGAHCVGGGGRGAALSQAGCDWRNGRGGGRGAARVSAREPSARACSAPHRGRRTLARPPARAPGPAPSPAPAPRARRLHGQCQVSPCD